MNRVTAKTAKTIVQCLGGYPERAQPPARHLVQRMDRYDGVMGPVRDRMASIDGNQPGDPAKAAQVIITVLGTVDAPLRLTLGNDAVDAIRAAWNAASPTSPAESRWSGRPASTPDPGTPIDRRRVGVPLVDGRRFAL